MKLLTDLANKKTTPQFIFLSPEKIATDGFLEYCLACRKEDIKLLVIDDERVIIRTKLEKPSKIKGLALI